MALRLGRVLRAAGRLAAAGVALCVGLGAAAQATPDGPAAWTVNGKAMPIGDFVAQVADVIDKTIVLDPRVKNQEVTVISNVSLDADGVYALFLTVLKAHGLGVVVNDDVLSIVQQPAIRQSAGPVAEGMDGPADQFITQVVPVSYVQSTELQKILRQLLPQTSHIAAIEQPNVLLIAAYAANMERILKVVREVDVVDKDEVIKRPLEHAWVGSLATVLEEIAPDEIGRSAKGPRRVQIVANERDNSLVLRGKAHAIAEALRLIDKLDVAETATNAARVIHLNHADAATTAPLLDQLVNGGVGGEAIGPVASILADETLNALIIRADPTTLNEILATVAQLDVRRAQVLIEAAVVEVSVNTVDNAGVEWAAGDGRGSTVPVLSTTLNGIVSGLLTRLGESGSVSVDPLAVASGFTAPTIALARLDADGIGLGAVITALATDTQSNLLSNPSVLTLDNEEATNVSGQQIPFRTGSFTTTTDGASNPFQTINRENVGVELKVTPHIHEDLSMRLVVSLEVGNVANTAESGGINVGASGFADIVTNNRSLQTTVLADDKEIILLGGLIQDDYRDIERRVPLLSRVPLLGRAFRSKRETLIKRHLLMFLRPTVLLSAEAATDTALDRYQGIYGLGDDDKNRVPADLEEVFSGVGG